VAADGVYGPLTADAVTRFQRDKGLAQDGIAGPRTLAALRDSQSLWNRLRRAWAGVAAFFGVIKA
jgi:peptidoglycan hydrolase-like protein with peptidoglycan-binding domain